MDSTPESPKVETSPIGEKPSVEKEEKVVSPVIGIDFGTQTIVVAIATKKQEFLPKVVLNNLSNHQTPNIVSFKGDERTIGEEALSQFVSFPKGTISQYKRLLGKDWKDVILQSDLLRLPYTIKESEGKILIEVNYQNENILLSPEQVAAMVLSKIKWFVEKKEEATTDCVISIPLSFDGSQRAAIIDAAKIAGLNVLGLVHENTAAALAYGASRNMNIQDGVKKQILLLDQGHSYFSAQVIEFTKDKLEVLSSANDDTLGARIFDFALFDHAANDFKNKTSLDVKQNVKSVCRLLNTCEKSKQILSTIPSTDLSVECLMNDRDVSIPVSRAFLESSCEKDLERLTAHIQKVIEASGVPLENLDVEVIGGGLRIPLCQERIKKSLNGKELRFSLDSAHCISIGAALMGKILKKDFEYNYVVNDKFNIPASQSKFSDEELEKAQKLNQKLIEDDKLISRKKDAKNGIEAYIYSTRNQLSDPSLASHFQDAEKKDITQLLEEAENWVIDESDQYTYDVVEERFRKIKSDVAAASQGYSKYLAQKEEERIKAQQEAEEYARLHPVSEATHKDRREPKTKGEKIEASKKRKNQGNTLFKEGDFENAILRYTQAVGFFSDIFDLSPDEKKEVDDLKVQSYLNLAACWLKLKKYEKAKENCTAVLKVDENNVKALFRRGQASYYLKDLEPSNADLLAASKLDPTNTEVKKTLKAVQEKLKEQQDKEKKMYQKMFG